MSIIVKIVYFTLIFSCDFVILHCCFIEYIVDMKITSAEFIKSVVDIKQCPNLNLPEFAFF
jgi:hypothetical protein